MTGKTTKMSANAKKTTTRRVAAKAAKPRKAATKSPADLFGTFGLWFSDSPQAWQNLIALFTPDAGTSLQSWSWTQNFLLLNLLQDVSSQVLVLDPAKDWTSAELDACPPLHSVDASAVDDEDSDDYWLVATGFLTPSTLSRGTVAGVPATAVKSSPSFFDASGHTVEQHFAVSKDGTKIPYFQVGPKDLTYDGGNPTLLSGYGGFEVSRTPAYSGTVGRAWLQQRTAEGRGGVYVLANIRGGGEFGPAWHRAAKLENRQRAYDDFLAVAEAGSVSRAGLSSLR